MTQTKMIEAIQNALPDAQVEIQDTTGTGDHFDLVVSSNLLEGKVASKNIALFLNP